MHKLHPGILFFLAVASLLACGSTVSAQVPEAAPQMADTLRADGKIWVVVLVLATIFAGIIIALIRTDRKLSRLERERRAQ